jgi:fatty-acyl-CoA synthase
MARIKARQGVELISSVLTNCGSSTREGEEVPHDGMTLGEITVRGNVVMEGYYNNPEAAAIRNG